MKKPVVVILLFIVGSILFYSAASLALSSPWGQGWWTGYFKGEHVPEYTSSGRLIVYDRVIDCGGANAFSESDFKPDLGQTAIKAAIQDHGR